MAETKQFKSIALPVLGTGNLKYPANQVCQCMFDVVQDWGMKHDPTHLKTIKFVLHSKDHRLIEVSVLHQCIFVNLVHLFVYMCYKHIFVLNVNSLYRYWCIYIL